MLVLTIGINGEVTAADSADGVEPFASVALSAARTWRFEPATRESKPVAARIRFQVRFTAPPPPPPPVAPAPASSAPQNTPPPAAKPKARTFAVVTPPDAEPVEVVVQGTRTPPGSSSFGRAEVRQLPGAFGDPFRAIEALPGVTPIVSGLPFFYVRGAPPGNIGYFLDGIRVPYLYHVGLGPSVIHPGLVDRVDLHPGGYPAQFGRFAGGIVSAETNEPFPKLHGEGNVRLFDMGALVETPFADGKGSALLAGRYSYTAAIISLIAKNTRLDYRDFEARATYNITPRDRVTVFGFGAYDYLAQTTNGIESTLFGSEFYRVDTRYDHTFSPGTAIRAAVTLGLDQTRVPDQPRNQRDRMIAGRIEATSKLSDVVTVRGGTDITIDSYQADLRPYSDPEDPTTIQFNALFPARSDLAFGAWADAPLRFRGVQITPGIRTDVFRSGDATAVGVDPRISSRIQVAEKIHVIHTFGLAHQPPSFIIPIPGLAVGNLRGGLQTSVQASGGVEVELPEATTASLTAFENLFLNMSDTLSVAERGQGSGALKEPRSQGSTIGAELYIRRRLTRRLGGYVAYTLSRSMRSVGAERFPSAFDRTHVANTAVAYDLGRRWRAGTRLTVYSGTPKQPASNGGLIAPPRSENPDRDPFFYRIDLRIEKRWVFTDTVWLSFVAEMLNATMHKEVLMGRQVGPVSIPSVGVEGAF